MSSIYERKVGGLASIREESSCVMEEYVDSIETIKLQHFNRSHSFIHEGFGLAVRVFVESLNYDMANWCCSFLEDTSYEKAVSSNLATQF